MPPIAIVLNGASSSGKTSIARAMQAIWPSPLIHASLDAFTDVFRWPVIREAAARRACHEFGVATFHDYLTRVAASEFSVVVDHVFELHAWYECTLEALHDRPTFVVAVRCDVETLEARERERGDRKPGLSRSQHQRVHDSISYDLEINTGRQTPEECAELILNRVNATTGSGEPTVTTRPYVASD